MWIYLGLFIYFTLKGISVASSLGLGLLWIVLQTFLNITWDGYMHTLLLSMAQLVLKTVQGYIYVGLGNNAKQFFQAIVPLYLCTHWIWELQLLLISASGIFCLFHVSHFGRCVGFAFENQSGEEQWRELYSFKKPDLNPSLFNLHTHFLDVCILSHFTSLSLFHCVQNEDNNIPREFKALVWRNVVGAFVNSYSILFASPFISLSGRTYSSAGAFHQ